MFLRVGANANISAAIAYANALMVIVEENSWVNIETKAANAAPRRTMQFLRHWCDKVKLTISTEKTTYVLVKGNFNGNLIIRLGDSLRRQTVT